jgi:nucleotide-binding universal stress UspA family protein
MMRWMIGLDLEARSRGVLELAGWLRACARAPAAQEFVAVHVLDERARRLLGADQQHELVAFAERALHEFVDEFDVAPAVTSWRIVSAETPERGISEALGADELDGLVIGGLGERVGRRLPRLGRVARRLLRGLPRPFWGEPLVVQALPHRIPADVDEWASSIGLDPIRTRLAEGDVLENVLDIAKLENTPLIICGSRKLDAFDRVFASSTSLDLATHSARPVIVVPSH